MKQRKSSKAYTNFWEEIQSYKKMIKKIFYFLNIFAMIKNNKYVITTLFNFSTDINKHIIWIIKNSKDFQLEFSNSASMYYKIEE